MPLYAKNMQYTHFAVLKCAKNAAIAFARN